MNISLHIYGIIGLVFVLLYFIGVFNSLVAKRAQTQEAWSTVDTQLKRRYDLIPNLIETVKGYAKHERETLENVIQARNTGSKTLDSKDVEQIAQSEKSLNRCLRSISLLKEAYPDLKANKNFIELQNELSDTESKIQASRQFYNTCVLSLNTAVDSFPTSIVASVFGFKKVKYFEIDEVEKQNPKVSF